MVSVFERKSQLLDAVGTQVNQTKFFEEISVETTLLCNCTMNFMLVLFLKMTVFFLLLTLENRLFIILHSIEFLKWLYSSCYMMGSLDQGFGVWVP